MDQRQRRPLARLSIERIARRGHIREVDLDLVTAQNRCIHLEEKPRPVGYRAAPFGQSFLQRHIQVSTVAIQPRPLAGVRAQCADDAIRICRLAAKQKRHVRLGVLANGRMLAITYPQPPAIYVANQVVSNSSARDSPHGEVRPALALVYRQLEVRVRSLPPAVDDTYPAFLLELLRIDGLIVR